VRPCLPLGPTTRSACVGGDSARFQGTERGVEGTAPALCQFRSYFSTLSTFCRTCALYVPSPGRTVQSTIKPRLRGSAAQLLLEQQIKLFVDNLRTSSTSSGDAVESILTSPREREVLRMVTSHAAGVVSNQLSHRPGSSQGLLRPASSVGLRRPSTSMSQATSSSAPEVLAPMKVRVVRYMRAQSHVASSILVWFNEYVVPACTEPPERV
jgi:hypothetical protein